MRPSSTRSLRRPRPWLAALLTLVSLAATVPAAAGAATPAAPTPADAGSHALATFTGSIKGIAMLSDTGGGDTRVRITLRGVPSGPTRLVGSTADCGTPLSAGNRVFSLTYQKIQWVRATVAGLMEEEGIFSLQSLRLVHPGASPTQVACKPVTWYVTADPLSVAVELENTLISSYSIVGGTRGMIVAGPSFKGVVQVRAMIQRMKSGVSYRLVGSTRECGAGAHTGANTVFSAPIPANGFTSGGITHDDDWEDIKSFRIFRGSGFSRPAGCIQSQIDVLETIA